MITDWLEGKETEDYLVTEVTSHPCGECGKDFTIKFNGKRFLFGSECAEAGGLKDLKVTILVPSGTLVFANDFRELVEDTEYRNINIHIESMRVSQDYVKHGMFHSYVGNSCPSIFLKDDVITVGTKGYNEDDDSDIVLIEGAEGVGNICTDLWWFSAMDKDKFTNTCMHLNSKLENPLSISKAQKRMHDWVDCEVSLGPGTYEMIVFARSTADGDYLGERFVEIRKINPRKDVLSAGHMTVIRHGHASRMKSGILQ